jgi:RND superfamily putative drug exporter
MATFLYRLGKGAFRRRRAVLALWLAIIAAFGIGAATLSGATTTSFSIPGAESMEAFEKLEKAMPQAGLDKASAKIVFVSTDGKPVTEKQSAIDAALTKVRALENVVDATDPFLTQTISRDLTTAYATVTYDLLPLDIAEAQKEALFEAGRSAESAGLKVDYVGTAVTPSIEGSIGEAIGLAVAVLVLVITFGSLLAAGMPLITALTAVGIGTLGIAIATGFADVSATTATLASMLGIAVGIDYSLLIVSRYRHELLRGRKPEEAAGIAIGTAGSAVVFAGATVVIALAALTIVGIPFLSSMGIAAAATVAVAVIVALTLLPAVLGFVGTKVLGRKGLQARDAEGDDVASPMGERWAGLVVRKRIATALLVFVGLGLTAVPALDLRLSLPSDGTSPAESTQRQAYDAISKAFGPGMNGTLLVTADLAKVSDAPTALFTIGRDLASLPGIVFVTPAQVTPDQSIGIFTLVPAEGPDAESTKSLVKQIRAQASDWEAATGVDLAVTGETAIGLDVSQRLQDALLPYLAVVIGLALLLLMLVFRSVLVPIKAVVGFLLSVFATLGAVVAVFQWGHLADLFGVQAAPIMSFLPIFLVGTLFGLAMDYEVFLVTRIREEYVHGRHGDDSIRVGFRHSARVVTAAALIMVSVFAGFVTSGESMVKSIGFALAFGVFVDAFIVRMTLVPALMSLLGDRAWWLPRWLDRSLPNVDVEGERLTAMLKENTAAIS